MKKIIVLLIITSLITTSCVVGSNSTAYLNDSVYIEDTESTELVRNKNTYVTDEMKETVEKINSLADKYKDEIDRGDFGPIYVDIYVEDNIEGSIQDIFSIDNANYNYSKEYFNDVVEILDENISIGLKSFVQEASEMKLDLDEQIIEKIGRTVVHVERDSGRDRNYIGIRTRLTDAKDEEYRDLFKKISKDNYILDNIYTEGRREESIENRLSHDLISFVNPEILINSHIQESIKVRYDLLLLDKEINKVNVLLFRKDSEKLKKEDMEVFSNLLDFLNIKDDKGELLELYENIFREKDDKITIDTEDYNISIIKNKGNNYIGERKENAYISIERK